MHICQGNKNRALKVDYWNAGSADLENKLNQSKNVIQSRYPHVLFIGEANLWKDADREKCKLDGYTLVPCSMIKNDERKCSWIVGWD